MTNAVRDEHSSVTRHYELDFSVDESLCTSCGLCVQDCPVGLIQGYPPHVEEGMGDRCLRCQHCMAICPTAALSIEGRRPEESADISKNQLPSAEQMHRLIRNRRSVRSYQDRDVDPSLIQQLLHSTAHAPTAVNALGLTFTVIDQRSKLIEFRERVLSTLTQYMQEGRVPDHLGFLRAAPAAFYDEGRDLIFRSAPHVLIASVPLNTVAPQTDVSIALTTFELLAVSSGLGTVWCGMLRMVLEIAPELKAFLELPTEGIHYYPLLFGYPAVSYARTVQRDNAAIVKLLSQTSAAILS
jgi:ferredoxin